MVGDYDLGTSLRDVLVSYPHIVGDNGTRQCPSLCGSSAAYVCDVLDGILYRGDIARDDIRFIEAAARFSIEPKVDVFSKVSVYCLGCDITARLIARQVDEATIREFRTPLSLVETTISTFYALLDAAYENARSREISDEQ